MARISTDILVSSRLTGGGETQLYRFSGLRQVRGGNHRGVILRYETAFFTDFHTGIDHIHLLTRLDKYRIVNHGLGGSRVFKSEINLSTGRNAKATLVILHGRHGLAGSRELYSNLFATFRSSRFILAIVHGSILFHFLRRLILRLSIFSGLITAALASCEEYSRQSKNCYSFHVLKI